MMASKVTPAAKEEEVEVEVAKEVGGTAKVTGSTISILGHFNQSWASFCQT